LHGRSLEQRCAILGRIAPSFHQITFHFGEKEYTARAPPTALGKFLLRRCQVDTAVSFTWERDVVYGLCFCLPPPVSPDGKPVGTENLEVWLELENPIWLYDFNEVFYYLFFQLLISRFNHRALIQRLNQFREKKRSNIRLCLALVPF
jgi:hypothetical protein